MKILAKIDDNVQICIRKTHDVTTKVVWISILDT